MNKKSLLKVWKWSKWIFASVIVLCLLLTGGVYLMRDKVVDKVVSELNKNLNTPVDVSSIDLTFWGSFPNISVDFNDLFIQDATEKSQKTDTLFYSKRVRLKFNPMDLIQKNYKVKKIEVYPGYAHIKNFSDGRNNYEITKPSKDTSTSSFEFSLNQVAFEDFRFDYSNYEAQQFHSTRLDEMVLSGDFNERIIELNAESNLHINYAKSGEVKLVQNQSAYFDLNLLINQEDGSMVLKEAPITIAELPFTFGLVVQPNLIDVRLKAKDLKLVQVAQSIQHSGTDKVKDLQGQGNVQFDLHFSSKRQENSSGIIECNFGITNGNIVEPSKNLRISNINVKGYYGNADKNKGEHVDLKTLRFQTAAGPFSGQLLLTSFDQPRYRGNATGKVDLGILHSIFPIAAIQSAGGIIGIESDFDIQSTTAGVQLNKCDGDLKLSNVQCQFKDDKRYFDHVTGRAFYKNNIAGLENFSLTVGKSDLKLNGTFEQLQAYINNSGNLKAHVEVLSAFLDVQDFATNEKAVEIKNGRNYILPNNIDGNLRLLANNLQYDNHQFKKLSTHMIVNGRQLRFTDLALQNAGADIKGQVVISESSPEIFTISTNASSNNIAFQPLFKEWDNFEQDVISADNISGIAQAHLQFSAPFDLRSGIESKNITATVDLRIDDGRLKNVEAFKSITQSLQSSKVTKMILKENNIQDFEKNLLNLEFATLQNKITIENGKLTIPKMTIVSNALTVNLAGTHYFNNEVDYHFDFNLRDIKKVQTNTEFGQVTEDGTGLRLFAHMFGNLDDPTIKWDREQNQLIAKASLEQEKKTTKEMLKAELGLFKKDSTVTAYHKKTQAREEIKMQFGNDEEDETPVEKTPKKDTKIGNTLKKWKTEAQKSNDSKFSIAPD